MRKITVISDNEKKHETKIRRMSKKGWGPQYCDIGTFRFVRSKALFPEMTDGERTLINTTTFTQDMVKMNEFEKWYMKKKHPLEDGLPFLVYFNSVSLLITLILLFVSEISKVVPEFLIGFFSPILFLLSAVFYAGYAVYYYWGKS